MKATVEGEDYDVVIDHRKVFECKWQRLADILNMLNKQKGSPYPLAELDIAMEAVNDMRKSCNLRIVSKVSEGEFDQMIKGLIY